MYDGNIPYSLETYDMRPFNTAIGRNDITPVYVKWLPIQYPEEKQQPPPPPPLRSLRASLLLTTRFARLATPQRWFDNIGSRSRKPTTTTTTTTTTALSSASSKQPTPSKLLSNSYLMCEYDVPALNSLTVTLIDGRDDVRGGEKQTRGCRSDGIVGTYRMLVLYSNISLPRFARNVLASLM